MNYEMAWIYTYTAVLKAVGFKFNFQDNSKEMVQNVIVFLENSLRATFHIHLKYKEFFHMLYDFCSLVPKCSTMEIELPLE